MHHCAFPWEGWERLSKYIDTNDWKRFIPPLVISAANVRRSAQTTKTIRAFSLLSARFWYAGVPSRPFFPLLRGMGKGSEGSGPNKERVSNALSLPLRIEAKTYWTFCRTVWTSFPDMFLTRAYTPRLWPLVSTILRPWIYAPRSIGLHSTLHRLTLHVASAYAPRCIGLRSTEHRPTLHVVSDRTARGAL